MTTQAHSETMRGLRHLVVLETTCGLHASKYFSIDTMTILGIKSISIQLRTFNGKCINLLISSFKMLSHWLQRGNVVRPLAVACHCGRLKTFQRVTPNLATWVSETTTSIRKSVQRRLRQPYLWINRRWSQSAERWPPPHMLPATKIVVPSDRQLR